MNTLHTILLILISTFVFAQEAKPHIEVTGSAERDIDPNIIILSVRIKEFEENKVKMSLDKIDKDLLGALSKAGVEKKNIVLSDLTANAVWQKRKDREVFSQKAYRITFSKNEEVLRFLDLAKDVKIDNLEVVELSHTDIAKFRLEIKVDALKAAEKKADALLEAAGAKRGKVLLIQEVQDFNPSLPGGTFISNSYNARYAGDMNLSYQGADIQMEKINLRYEILAHYAID